TNCLPAKRRLVMNRLVAHRLGTRRLRMGGARCRCGGPCIAWGRRGLAAGVGVLAEEFGEGVFLADQPGQLTKRVIRGRSCSDGAPPIGCIVPRSWPAKGWGVGQF
ncbi:MAG: hypothetical protein K0S56_616, partial [Microvirga sp.]|nr:hypothetical protein [Microvirga sp.]